MLSYQPDTVEKDLAVARDQLTGAFRDSYTSLTRDVVVPGAKDKQVPAVATVPAARRCRRRRTTPRCCCSSIRPSTWATTHQPRPPPVSASPSTRSAAGG